MNASRSAKQRMPHTGRSKPYVQSLQIVLTVHPYKNSPISPAARQAQLQGQRSLQRQQTWPQGWPKRGPALEARLQVQY